MTYSSQINPHRILTFDIEEWFHILDVEAINDVKKWDGYQSRIVENVDRILFQLEERKIISTFFCLGWIAEKYPEVIRKIDNHGHEIGTHSHLHQLVYQQKLDDFRQDLNASIKYLEDIIGKKVKSYRSPGFSLNRKSLWALDVLVECGIEVDCSIFPAPRSHGGIHDFKLSKPFLINHNGSLIKEFPMSTWGIGVMKFGLIGGGYFRLVPYDLLKQLVRRKTYLMTYFHPRDFDYGQPILNELSIIRRFRSYYGLKDSFKKFNKFTEDFEFMSLAQAQKLIDWSKVETVYL